MDVDRAAVQTKTNPAAKQHHKQLLRVIMYKDTHKKHQTTNKQDSLCGYVRLPNRGVKFKGEKTQIEQS